MRKFLAVIPGLLAVWVAASPAARADPVWRESVTPHFRIEREAGFLPPGFSLFLEKLHGRLSLDLAMLSPWMAKDRVTLYLYASAKSYYAGRFKPPQWSNGIAYADRKIIAVYDQPDRAKFMEIVAHEMTHMVFESYWRELHQEPPHWLNEGLAMMEESDSDGDADRSEWFKAMGLLPMDKAIPVERLVRINPNNDLKDKETITIWYVESYSLVYFLYRRHTRLQFLNFCRRLRDGEALARALWEVYRFRNEENLEAAWKTWLREEYHTPRSARGPSSAPGSRKTQTGGAAPLFKSGDFKGLSFHSFRGEPSDSKAR